MSEENCIDLPNGHVIYWKDNKAGGRTYISSEVGYDGYVIHDSAITNESSLLRVLENECKLNKEEPKSCMNCEHNGIFDPICYSEFEDVCHNCSRWEKKIVNNIQ